MPESQWYDWVWWLHYVSPRNPAEPLLGVSALLRSVKPCMDKTTWSGVPALLRLSQHPHLKDCVPDFPHLHDYFELPSSPPVLAKYLELGPVLARDPNPEWWVLWSRSVLLSSEKSVAERALCSYESSKLPIRLQAWLGGWDLAAWVRQHPNAFVFGGAVVAAEHDVEHVRRGFDVDVCIMKEDQKTLLSLLETFCRTFPDAVLVVRAGILDAVSSACQASLQVVFTREACPWTLVTHIDLDYVKAYFDGRTVWQMPECALSWKDRTVRRATKTSVSSWRLEKIAHKGFVHALPLSIEAKQPTDKRWKYYRHQPGEPWLHIETIWKALCPGAQLSSQPQEAVSLLLRGSYSFLAAYGIAGRSVPMPPEESKDTSPLRFVRIPKAPGTKFGGALQAQGNVPQVTLTYAHMRLCRSREGTLHLYDQLQHRHPVLKPLIAKIRQTLKIPTVLPLPVENSFFRVMFCVSDKTQWFLTNGRLTSRPPANRRKALDVVKIQAHLWLYWTDKWMWFSVDKVWFMEAASKTPENSQIRYFSSGVPFG